MRRIRCALMMTGARKPLSRTSSPGSRESSPMVGGSGQDPQRTAAARAPTPEGAPPVKPDLSGRAATR